jgi:hypothetical protein
LNAATKTELKSIPPRITRSTMNLVIEIQRGGTCAICREDFSLDERQFTHVGEKGHKGFHKKCLARWVSLNPTCPLDRMPIDPRSILSRTERIMARLRPALANGASAVCLVLASEIVSGASGAALGSAVGQRISEVLFKRITAVAAAVGSAGAGAVVAFNPGVREAKALVIFGGLLAVVGAVIEVGISGAGTAGKVEQVAWAIVCNGAAFGTGAAVGKGILNRSGGGEIARHHIGMGLYLAGMVMMIRLNDPAGGTLPLLSLFSTSALVAGVTAGILSLIRR